MLFGIPLFQNLVLAPTGYVAAVNAIIAHDAFGPLLVWTAAHPLESRLFRVFEVIPFLLALGLPGPLHTVLWNDQPRQGRVAIWFGRIGFALFALALFIGMFTSAASAASYISAPGPITRSAIASDYAGRYALETLLSRVLGGLCITVFVLIVSLRMVRTRRLPLWFAILGMICAALEATNALFFAFGPAQATTPPSGLAYFALAAWLLVAGILLLNVRPLPTSSTTPPLQEQPR